MIERLVQDLRYAARTFRRAPGFLLLTVLTIARRRRRQRRHLQHRQRGAAAAAAVRAPRRSRARHRRRTGRPDRTTATPRRRTSSTGASAQHSFTGLAAFRQATFALSGGDRPESVAGAIVNANFFDVLDVKPALGRGFDRRRRRPGRAARRGDQRRPLAAAVRRARRTSIGQTIRINDEPHTIVGVMPAGIDYPDRSRVWVPPHWRVPDDPLAPDVDPVVAARPRLLFGAGAVQRRHRRSRRAQADMDAVAASLERDFPDEQPEPRRRC